MANKRRDEEDRHLPDGNPSGSGPSSSVPSDLPEGIGAPPPPGSRARLPSQLRRTGRQRQESALDSGAASQPVVAHKEAPPRHSETEAYVSSLSLPTVAPSPTVAAEPASAEMSPSGFKPASGHQEKAEPKVASAATPAAAAAEPTPAVAATSDGVTLRQVIAREPMSADEAVRLLCRIASPLQRLHADDKAHGTLTPAHALFEPDEKQGKVQLLDPAQVSTAPKYLAFYTAPEVSGALKTGKVSPVRAEVYALGCMLFEALTGRAPFVGRRIEDVNKRHAKFAVPAVRQVRNDIALPPALELEIQRALKKRAGDRHSNAGEFASAITNANAEDDRGTLHFSLEEANVLQELIEQKTRGAEQEKRLAEEQQKLMQDRERVEQERERLVVDKEKAAQDRVKAEAARQEAAQQRAQAEISEVAALSALRKSNIGLILGLLGLMSGIAGGAWFFLSGPTESPPAPVAPAPVLSVEPADAGVASAEPDAAPDVAPDVAVDAAVDAVDGVDAVDATKDPVAKPVKVKRRPKPKPKLKVRPKPRAKPKPKPDPNRPVTF